jgi:hypothetical protein
MSILFPFLTWNYTIRTKFEDFAVSIAYSECVFVALGIQHAMTLRYIFICGLSCSLIFPHYLINGTTFDENLLNIKYVLFLHTNIFLKNFSFQRELSEIRSKFYVDFHVKYSSFLSDLNFLGRFSKDSEI